MDLSIIILNYNTCQLVKYAIKHLKETIKSTSYEIIVVDNATYDGVEEMLEDFYPEVKFIQNSKNTGFSAGNNVGIWQAQGDYIMVMNPDIYVQEGAVDRMVDYAKNHPEVGLVAPKLLNPDKSLQYSCRRFQNLKSILYRRTPLGQTAKGKEFLENFLMLKVNHDQEMEIDWAMGACHLFRRSNLAKVGSYDERFFFYVEDMEFCRRFWMNNLKVMYLPQAVMIHLHEQGSHTKPWGFLKLNKMVRRHIVSYIRYLLKYFNNPDYGQLRTK